MQLKTTSISMVLLIYMNKKMIAELNKMYGLELKRVVKKVEGGFLSDNLIVGNDDDKFFLRKYRDKYTLDEVENIHKSKQFFYDHGIPIIMPLKTKNGKTIVNIDNSYYGLFPFVSAKILSKEEISNDAIGSIAQMQAKMHLLSRKSLPQVTDRKTGIWNKEKAISDMATIEKVLSKKKKMDKFDEIASKCMKLKKNIILNNKIRFEDLKLKFDHLVHGDFHCYNLFYDDKNHVKYVFDLEKTDIAPRAFELARAIDFVCLHQGEKDSVAKAGHYLKSYREIYQISNQEFRSGFIMHYLKSAHTLWIEKNHYLENNLRTDVFYEDDYNKLRYFSKDLEKILDEILEKPN